MSRDTDFDIFLQACYRWLDSDDQLAVEFQSPGFTQHVKEAYCDLRNYDYYNRQIFPSDFYREVTLIVNSRAKCLRDKLLDLKRGREGVPSPQLTFKLGE